MASNPPKKPRNRNSNDSNVGLEKIENRSALMVSTTFFATRMRKRTLIHMLNEATGKVEEGTR